MKPRTDYKDPLDGVTSELMSAMSALNMLPNPIPAPEGSMGFVSEVDGWAKHSMEHMQAVYEMAAKAKKERDRLKDALGNLLETYRPEYSDVERVTAREEALKLF